MRTKLPLLSSLLLAFAGCEKPATPPAPTPTQESAKTKLDACELITKEEVESIVGLPITETKSSQTSDRGFRVWQCFYTAADFSKSVSLAVTQQDPKLPDKGSPKDLWRKIFARSQAEQKKDRNEEEKSPPPKKIDGIGDDAYWTGTVSGTLYVLGKNAFVRISVGGLDNEETKLNKSKALAEKALPRL